MSPAADVQAQLLHARLEMLRLRTLGVGALAILILVLGLTTGAGHASAALKTLVQVLFNATEGVHVPANMFQAPADWAWTRSPVLLQLAFVVIGIGGIVQMTRQVLGAVQVRLWVAVLLGLSCGIVYTNSDLGSVWQAQQRELVKTVRAKDWARVEQLSSTSRNSLAHAYVMAQVGLAKPDAVLLQLHGKALVDQIDDTLMRRGQDREARDFQVFSAGSEFEPRVLRDLDVAVYGAPHTEIGLSLGNADALAPRGGAQGFGSLTAQLLGLAVAGVGIAAAFALLRLWKAMRARLHRLRPQMASGG
jgi:hypothetical protein